MEKRLLLKDTNGELIAELLSFTYNAKRMGGAPTISATLHSFDELTLTTDDYVEFNGEKYYIKHTPTSSKSNTDARYKYDLEFVSERIMLDDIYFYDTTHSTSEVSKSIAKSADFLFSGTIHDLADKINSSLEVSKIGGYAIVIGEDIKSSEYKQITFSNTFISNAIQEFYNTFEVPYYFEWDATLNKTLVHVTSGIAKSPNVAFEYGKDNALLSITKTNANYKIVNRATGIGSSENIPYYYPNESASGKHTFEASPDFEEVTVNYDVLSKHANIADGETLVYHLKKTDIAKPTNIKYINEGGYSKNKNNATSFVDTVDGSLSSGKWRIKDAVRIEFLEKGGSEYTIYLGYAFTVVGSDTETSITNVCQPLVSLSHEGEATLLSDNEVHLKFNGEGWNTYYLSVDFEVEAKRSWDGKLPLNLSFSFYRIAEGEDGDYFDLSDGSKLLVAKSGIKVKTPFEGGVISISKMLNWVEPQKTLMPSIYRGTLGQERFYNAINGEVKVPFIDSDNANTDPDEYSYSFPEATFVNPFNEGRPKEHIVTIDDIKPSIVGTEVNGERIDMFSAFAYDENDNNELDEENHYKHPYFYAKLKKLGFNLFDHANENGEMTVSFTSGDCSACNFIIGVDEDTQKNTVQVDENGDLLRDEHGDVRSGREGKPKEKAQERQQDTINNEVWIALKKEDSTFGTLYPNATEKPSTEDTFVITNINLPLEYILAAEKRLEERIKQYLIDNNSDKFNFSIKFSRIYLADEKNKDVRDQITENSSIKVIYQGKEATLYVSSYTYKMTAGEALPEISVELSDTLSVSNGVMRNVINQVKAEVMTSVANVDIVAQGARAFVRKDQNDQTVYRLTANEMNVVKGSNVGGSLDVGDSASIGGELTVGRKAGFSDDVNVGGDVNVGEYTEILGEISGAKISQDGSAIFKSVRANALEIFTLIYNQIRATSAYTAFDDSGTITELSVDDKGLYTITFDQSEFGIKDENGVGVQPFFVGDILHGYVNNINMFEYSQAGECWMRVEAIPSKDNELTSSQIQAILYSDEQVPTSQNLPPTTQMTLMHRGNAINTDRQTTFYISSRDGNIIQLLGVDSPKLYTLMSEDNPDNYSNYGVVIGKLPIDLFKYVHQRYSFIKETDPALYAKYLVVQNLLQIDYAGRPIKTENYRGEWKESIATDNEVDEYGLYVNRYKNTSTTYDTVTHNGSLWACQVSDTTIPPSDNVTEWLCVVSKGYGAVQYDLIPQPNIIYLRGSVLSSNELNAEVSKTSSDGVVKLTQQVDLDAEGLKVQWAIDGGERNELTIGDETVLVLDEEGTALDVAEATDTTDVLLYLEGEAIDVSAINDNITLYLVDKDSGEDIQKKVIPVVKDGADGKPVYVSPSMSSLVVKTAEHTENDGTTTVKTTEAIDSTIYCTLIYNDETLANIIDVSVSGFGAEADELKTDGRVLIKITIPIGTLLTELSTEIVVTLTGLDISGVEHKASVTIPVIPAMRGLAGPMGESGYFYYPANEWNKDIAVSDNGYAVDTATQSAPFVFYNGLYYYRTTNELNYSADGVLYTPSEDVANASNPAWRVIPEYQAIYAKILMVNWAQLGKAVFWGDYMFSQKGILEGSTGITDYVEDMFDEGGRLNGKFIPNLFLDLFKGGIKSNRLAETFVKFRDYKYGGDAIPANSDAIDLNNSYNVRSDGLGTKLLCMPLMKSVTRIVGEEEQTIIKVPYEPDGVHSMVFVNPSLGYENKIAISLRDYPTEDYYTSTDKFTWRTLFDRATIVCADPRFFMKECYRIRQSYPNGVFAPNSLIEYNGSEGDDFANANSESGPSHFFVVNGIFTKFILLEPGSICKMRSCVADSSNGEMHIWIVENASDFEQLDAVVTIETKYAYNETTGSIEQCGNTYTRYGFIGEGNYSIGGIGVGNNQWVGRIFGTNRMRKFYDLHMEKHKNTYIPVRIHIKMDDNEYGSYIDEISSVSNNTNIK